MIFGVKWPPSIERLLSHFFLHFFGIAIVREASWLVGGVALEALIQMGTLYYLTHNLGVERVGIFFALLSFFAIVVPFVQLGNYDLTVRQIARGEDPPLVAGRAMRSSIASFLFLLPVVLLLKPLVAAQVSWTGFLLMAVSELFVMRVLINVVAVATGFRLHYVSAISDFVMGLSRFSAVCLAEQLGAGLNEVLVLYAFTSAPAALGAYLWRRVGRPIVGWDHYLPISAITSRWFSPGSQKWLRVTATNCCSPSFPTPFKPESMVLRHGCLP